MPDGLTPLEGPRSPTQRDPSPVGGEQTPVAEHGNGALPFGRRRRSAASALVAMLVALALGALLNAPAMRKTALEQPFGSERSVRLALVDPLATVSRGLFLDRPAKLTADALGRPDPGPTGARVVAVVAPTPKPAKGGEKGDTPTKTLQEKPLPRPFKGHPMHLYIAGDSMLGLPGMALTNLSIKTKLIKPMLDYHISSGLVRPDFFDWPAQLQAKVESFHPGAVAVMFGANDNQPVQTASGKVHQFGSEGWKKEYRRRVKDVIAVLYQGGVRRVYWIGQPIMPNGSFNGQVKLMNEIYRSVAEETFGVQYVDAYKLFANGRGQYAQYLPDARGKMQQVREQDGEHLTYAGGLRIAEAVLAEIAREWFPKKAKGEAGEPSPKASKTTTPAP